MFVSAPACQDESELRQRLVPTDNARPLPKTMIYRLLPDLEGLAEPFTQREFSAHIIDLLTRYLVSPLKKALRKSRHVVNG